MTDVIQDIYTLARLCEDLLVQCLSLKDEHRLENMIDHQRRFMSWASYLGVFAPVKASLDARLETAPEVKGLVILLLNVLKRNLERVLKRAPSTLEAQPPGHGPTSKSASVESNFDGAFYGIVGAIDRLHRLAATIRHPSRSENMDKVLKYSQDQGPDGFDDMIILMMKFRFPDAPRSLRMQLAMSIIYRRNRLRYDKDHQRKLATDRIGNFVAAASPPTPEPVVSNRPQKHTQPSIQKRKSAPDRSETNPTTFRMGAYLQAQQTFQTEAPSVRSSGSLDQIGEVIYPRPPIVPDKSFHTECQFCFKEVKKVMIDNPNRWKSHVDTDIQPYVCLSESCGSFPPTFSQRRTWLAHMKEQHGSDWAQYIHCNFQYCCPCEHDTLMSFGTESELFQHLVSTHSEDIQEYEQRAIAERSKVAIPSEPGLCALCNQDIATILGSTERKRIEDVEKEPPRGSIEVQGQQSGELKVERGSSIAHPPPTMGPATAKSPEAVAGFVESPGHHEPDLTTAAADAMPCSDKGDPERFGSTQVKLHTHLAGHLRSLAFLSLRWWEEEGNSGSQGSREVSGRRSNHSQDLSDDAPAILSELATDCLNSLAFPEMFSQYDAIAPAEDETCRWLFLHETYNKWASIDQGLLDIQGQPGSGKSTLLRYVLGHISEAPKIDSQAITLSFFFDSHGADLQRTLLGFFRSLLYQLLLEVPANLSSLVETFKNRREQMGKPGVMWQWAQGDLQAHLALILSSVLRKRPIWLFIDAWDEADDSATLLQVFSSLLTPPLPFHVCLTSRYSPVPARMAAFEIVLESENRPAILTYVQLRLSGHPCLELVPGLDRLIADYAGGLFLRAFLMVGDVLELERRGETPANIVQSLRSLPQDLNELYSERIRRASHPKSLKLFQWTCFATRLMSLEELRWAILVDHDPPHLSLEQCEVAGDFPADVDEMKRKVNELSGSLVTAKRVDKDLPTWTVQLSHISVRDFLFERGLWDLQAIVGQTKFPTAEVDSIVKTSQAQLARACLQYLAMGEIVRSTSLDPQTLMSDFPLLHYATTSWVTHALHGGDRQHSEDDLLQCLGGPSGPLVEIWVQLYNVLDQASANCPSAGTTVIHIASRYHLLGLLRAALRTADVDKINFDARDRHGRTPLWWAAEHGDEVAVKLLLSTGKVDVDRTDNDGDTPIVRASRNGHDATVQLLVGGGNVELEEKEDGQKRHATPEPRSPTENNSSGKDLNEFDGNWRLDMEQYDYQYWSKMI